MKAPALLVAALVVASGCAQSPPAPEAVAENAAEDPAAAEAGETFASDDRVCKQVRRTGSHRREVICRSRAEIEQEASESKQTFDSLRNSQMNAGEYGKASDGRQ
jgi:hypothetical protein